MVINRSQMKFQVSKPPLKKKRKKKKKKKKKYGEQMKLVQIIWLDTNETSNSGWCSKEEANIFRDHAELPAMVQ